MTPNAYFGLFAVAAATFVASDGAYAQNVVVMPGQASQLPPEPSQNRAIPDLRVNRPGGAFDGEPTGPAVTISALHVTGQTRFTEAQLVSAAKFRPGASATLSDLRQMAANITDFYAANGFIVAQAYVPAQQISDGVVTIAVIEGRYGNVDLNNRSLLKNSVAHSVLNGLSPNDLIEAAPLERRLLLLSDLPGVEVSSTLSPGTAVGTSDLRVDLNPGRRFTGNLEADNAGSPFTGEVEGGGTINFNEPLGIGDVASLRVLTSGSGMQYGRASYQAQAGLATLGVAYAYYHYKLGKPFSALHAEGSEKIASLYGSYPLVRSYDNNLRVRLDLDDRTFQDKINLVSSVVNKKAQVVGLGLAGDHRDGWGGGGSDDFAVTVASGHLDLRTPSRRFEDAATSKTQGSYSKLSYMVNRLQSVAPRLSVYGAVRGQIASKNLDTSEQMELGGAYGVRAYPEGEAYGDEGFVASLEARLQLLTNAALPGRLQLAGFYDYGSVRNAKNPWLTGSNTATRRGAGVELSWASNSNFLAKVSYAWRLNGKPTSSEAHGPGQFWFQVVQFF